MRIVLPRTAAAAGAGAVVFATALLMAQPAHAAGTLTVSKTTGLAVGEAVTVSAKGLSKNQPFAPLGLCKPNPSGPADCNTAPDAAVIGKTDASGVWQSASSNATTAKITIKAEAGGVKCTSGAGACVIAVFITATKELVQVPLTVSANGGSTSGGSTSGGSSSGGSASGGSASGGSTSGGSTGGGSTAGGSTSGGSASGGSTSGGSSSGGASAGGSGSGGAASGGDGLAMTGSLDGIPVGLLAAGTLVLCGTSAVLLMPRRGGDAAEDG